MELVFVVLLSACCGVATEKSKTSVLYYTVYERHEIYRVPTSGGVAEPLNLSQLHCSVPYAIAHDPERNCLYWTNLGRGIGRKCPQGNISSIRLPGHRYGITVDPVSNLLYTTNYYSELIEVVEFNKKRKSTITRGDMSSPYQIVVDPQRGLLYWADWNKNRIEKVRTNGTQRMQLVADGIIGPQGVALNRRNSRVYFCGWYSVQSIGADGSGRQTHFQDTDYEFNSIAVDSEFLYVRSHSPSYSIWRLAIDSVNATGQDLQRITDVGSSWYGGIVLVESLLQETTHATTTDTTTSITTTTTTPSTTSSTTTDILTSTVDVNDVTSTTTAQTVTSAVPSTKATIAFEVSSTKATTVSEVPSTKATTVIELPRTKATIVFKVPPTQPSHCTSQDIYKYALLIAVPIMLVAFIVLAACFCIKTGKCASCRRSRTDGQQYADVYYEDVSAIPMSHQPLPTIAQGEATAAQSCEDYFVPVPSVSGARGHRGAAAAPKCADYLVPVPEPPHTYEEL